MCPTPDSPFQPSRTQPQISHPSLFPLSEYHSGFSDEDLGPPYGSPSPYSLANHRRQHSFPNLLPLALRSRSPSPTRKAAHTRSPSEQMPFTGDGRGNGRATADSARAGGGLISWLSGTAGAANALGLSPQGANGTSKDAAAPDTPPMRPRRSGTGASSPTAEPVTPKSTVATTASRFMSAISSRFNPTTPTSPAVDDDELYNLNIEAALFPPGTPSSDRDPFSPAAFKNLRMNALGLLARLQAAYRERVVALRDLQAERSAQRDELEAAETRARHLKMQLEGMARKAQEHEQAIRSLTEQLAAERMARAEERAGAEKNIAAVAVAMSPSEGASMVSEDLGVDEALRRRKRQSHRKSWKSGVSGEDTDEDESIESESVFSRCRSPGLPLPLQPVHSPLVSDAPPVMATPDRGGAPLVKNTGGGDSVNATPKQKRMSAFQKILKGISGAEDSEAVCANCKGQDASVAWDTVSLLRDENRHLKGRVGELEVAVEGALDLVNGIGL